jgi:sulfatase maturation enzyme AslB (radical SAM superfamily)
MSCNFRCSYCFLSDNEKKPKETFFSRYSAKDWVEAMNLYKDYEVEFYMWGGEPFMHPSTYKLAQGFAAYDFVKWARADTNLSFASKIVNECPTSKLKLNCSWHTEMYDFDDMWDRVRILNDQNMVGMVNFVASESNLEYLKANNLDLDDLINKFSDNGIYLNISADFSHPDTKEYREFITKYTTPEDYRHIHNYYPSRGVKCSSAQTMFTIENDGSLTTCGKKDFIAGNFFDGEINKEPSTCPQERCLSIVSYCHREDNDFPYKKHLDEYAKRNITHRLQTLR